MSATSAMSIDSKNLLSIQQLVPKKVEVNTESDLENILLLKLAHNVTASEIDASANLNIDISLNSTRFIPNHILINNTALETPNFAFTTTFTDVSSVLLDSSSVYIDEQHSGVLKKIEVLPNTSSYFDSHLKLTVTDVMTFYDNLIDTSANWTATFANDNSNANYNFVKAINSDLNTDNGELPLKIKEDVNFNLNYALGQNMNKYYTLDAINGKTIINNIDASNNVYNNQFSIIDTDLKVYEDKYMGTYRIEQTNDTPVVTFNPLGSVVESPLYNHSPAHGTVDISDVSGVPISLTYDEFIELFDINENMKILPEYKAIFTVDSSNGGYTFEDNLNYNYISIDDGALIDNPAYMENVVRHNHQITWKSGTGVLDFSANVTGLDSDNNILTSNTNQNNLDFFSLTNYGERISAIDDVNKDGQILLNKDTHATRIADFDLSANLNGVHVYNIGETPIDASGDTLNDADSTSRFVKYDVQNVLKLSGDGNNSYGSVYDSNGASMFFLDKGGFIPSTSDVSFTSFIDGSDGEAEFIKIGSNLILSSQDPIVDANNTIVENLGGYVYAKNISLPKLDFSKYNLKGVQKTIEEIALLTSANDVSHNGWKFIMDSTHLNNNITSNDTFLISGSDAVNNTNMPINAQHIVATDSSLAFTMVYGSAPESITIVHDYVNIFYDVDGVTQVITIPNNHIHKIFHAAPVKTLETVYEEQGNYNGSVIAIKKQTVTNVFTAKFMLPMQPYKNIVAITPKIKAVTTSYKAFNITDPSNPIAIPDAVIVKYYQTVHGTPYNGLYDAKMTLTVVENNTELNCEGLIEARDLKPWKVSLMAYDASNGLNVTVSNEVDGDVYYESASFIELNDTLEVDVSANNFPLAPNPKADLTVAFSLLEIPDSDETPDLTLNSSSYTLNLTNASGVPRFTVNNFTLNATNFHNTPLSNSGYLTATFDDIHSMISGNDYIAKITYEDLPVAGGSPDEIISTVVLTIMKGSIVHYVVKISQKIVSDMIIYKNNMDWYRIIKMIGSSDISNNKTTKFVQTNYPFVYDSGSNTTAFKVDNGIYIEGDKGSVDYGDRAVFRLKNVNVSVSTLGYANSTLTELYDKIDFFVENANVPSLSVAGKKITETITIDKYRNFYGLSNTTHKYTLVRVATILQLQVYNNTNLVTSQDWNDITYNDIVIVDNLVNSNYGAINLGFTPKYSIFPGNAPRIMDLVVTGDPVTIEIENPLQVVADVYPLTINKTLKDWDIYKYSGGVFNMASRRVKLQNANYGFDTFSYELYLEPRKVLVTYSSDYIGNPTTHTYDLMSNVFDDSNYPDSFTYYESINDASGVVIPGYIFQRSPTLATRVSVSYVVVAPPFLSFELMTDLQNDNHITELPYNYIDNSSNVVQLYLPVVDANIYNPFVEVDGGNNITFKRVFKPFYKYDTESQGLYEIFVLGNNIKIEEFFGLKSNITAQLLTLLYDGKINDLINKIEQGATLNLESNTNQNYIIKYKQNLSQFINDINIDNTLGNNGQAYNISIAIGNAFLNDGIYKLDLETGQGTNVEFISCSTTQENGKLALLFEKYSTDSPFDYSNLPVDTLRRISFKITKKQNKIVQLPSITFGNEPYHLEKTRRNITMTDVNGSWTDVAIDENFAFNFNIVALSNIGTRKMIELFSTSPTSPFKANYVTMKDLITMTSADGSAVYRVKYNGVVVSMFESLSAQFINPLPIYDSNQNSDNEYISYNVNHFSSLL